MNQDMARAQWQRAVQSLRAAERLVNERQRWLRQSFPTTKTWDAFKDFTCCQIAIVPDGRLADDEQLISRIFSATSPCWVSRDHANRGGTVPAKPWVTFRRPGPEREYLVLLSALPLKRFRDLGAFLLYTWRIQGQLRRTPGLLGYSLLAHILQRQFWTLSVWDDEAALQQFVVEHPHSQVMPALQEKMGQTRFVRWRIRGSEFPPRWQEALARQDSA